MSRRLANLQRIACTGGREERSGEESGVKWVGKRREEGDVERERGGEERGEIVRREEWGRGKREERKERY